MREWWRWRDAQNYWSSDLRMTYYCSVKYQSRNNFHVGNFEKNLHVWVFVSTLVKRWFWPNKVLPTQCLVLTNQEAIVVNGKDVGHKWLGCILSAGAKGGLTMDITYHSQAAAKAFLAHKIIFCDTTIRLAVWLNIFDWVIASVTFFCLWPWNNPDERLVQTDLHVSQNTSKCHVWSSGPQTCLEWNAPWHEILHHYNGSVSNTDWKLARNNAPNINWNSRCLPPNRWVKSRLVHEHGGTHGMIGQTGGIHAILA